MAPKFIDAMKLIIWHLRSAFFLWNLLVIVLLSLVSGFLIVIHGREEILSELLRMPGMLSSVMYSSVIAFILLLFIYGVSVVGNIKNKGTTNYQSWVVYQMVYGIGLTIVMELTLAATLYAVKGFWIFNTAFFDKIFLPVVLFIGIVNLGYLLFFMQRSVSNLKVVEVQTIRYVPVPEPVLTKRSSAEVLNLNAEAALFYIRDEEVWKKNFKGEREIWLESLDATMAKLDPSMYFKCSRTCIVNRNAVADVVPVSGRRLEVLCPFSVRIALIVSRRNTKAFKEWLDIA